MIIDSNNDIEEYEQNVVAGLNSKKTLYMVAAVGIMVILSVILYFAFKMSLVLCIYTASPIAAVVVVIGFYEKDGMSFLQRMKKKRGNSNKTIAYVSTENRSTYIEYNDMGKVIAEQAAEAKDEFEKTLIMLKRAAVGIVLIIILVVILLVVLL